jgi:hypothetical protein
VFSWYYGTDNKKVGGVLKIFACAYLLSCLYQNIRLDPIAFSYDQANSVETESKEALDILIKELQLINMPLVQLKTVWSDKKCKGGYFKYTRDRIRRHSAPYPKDQQTNRPESLSFIDFVLDGRGVKLEELRSYGWYGGKVIVTAYNA